MADQPEVPVDDKLIDQLLEIQESPTLETKRVGDNRRKLETVVSFANSEGGLLVLGMEDPQKASGRSRVFANRIEIENPGLLPGGVTVNNVGAVGSRPRNRALVDHLREFPSPPNLDAGEGVRMMKQTMSHASLYPPIFQSAPILERELVMVCLFNELRPSAWDQVEAYLETNAEVGNAEVRAILRTDDPVKASKLIKSWVDLGLLAVANPAAAKKNRRYVRPGKPLELSLFSERPGN